MTENGAADPPDLLLRPRFRSFIIVSAPIESLPPRLLPASLLPRQASRCSGAGGWRKRRFNHPCAKTGNDATDGRAKDRETENKREREPCQRSRGEEVRVRACFPSHGFMTSASRAEGCWRAWRCVGWTANLLECAAVTHRGPACVKHSGHRPPDRLSCSPLGSQVLRQSVRPGRILRGGAGGRNAGKRLIGQITYSCCEPHTCSLMSPLAAAELPSTRRDDAIFSNTYKNHNPTAKLKINWK